MSKDCSADPAKDRQVEVPCALDVATEAIVVEDEDVDTGPLLTHITTADPYNRGETRKEPDGTIIQEEFTV